MGERGTTERVLTLLGHEFEPLDATEVRTRIREMAALDPERARFGSRTHRYELRPALPEAEIGAFEEEHGIRLPRTTVPSWRRSATGPPDRPTGCCRWRLPARRRRTGPYAGGIWSLDPDWGGLVPAYPGFRAWYAAWLGSPA